MQDNQLITIGTITGFVAAQPDMVYVSNGYFVVAAYITGLRSNIRIGQTFNVYKQNSLYFLGTELQGQW